MAKLDPNQLKKGSQPFLQHAATAPLVEGKALPSKFADYKGVIHKEIDQLPKSSEQVPEAASVPLSPEVRTEAVRAPTQQESVGQDPEFRSKRIPLDLLDPNPQAPRVYYADEDVEALKVLFLKDGQHTPVTCYEENGRYVLIEGGTRRLAAKRAGWSDIAAIIRPKPDSLLKLYLEARSANVDRSEQTPFDDSVAWARLLDDKVVENVTRLATILSEANPARKPFDRTVVGRILDLRHLPESIRDLCYKRQQLDLRFLTAVRAFFKEVESQATPPSAAEAEEKTVHLLREHSASELSARKLELLVERLKQGKPLKPTRLEPTTYTYSLAGSGQVQFKAFSDGRLLVEGSNLTDKQLEKIRKTLSDMEA